MPRLVQCFEDEKLKNMEEKKRNSRASNGSKDNGQVYFINGVKVPFPVKAYPTQITMMHKVTMHLTERQAWARPSTLLQSLCNFSKLGATNIDPFTQNVQWASGGGDKRTGHFQNFFREFSERRTSENFLCVVGILQQLSLALCFVSAKKIRLQSYNDIRLFFVSGHVEKSSWLLMTS